MGHADLDHSGLVKLVEQMASTELTHNE
jgi:hypothetical protein